MSALTAELPQKNWAESELVEWLTSSDMVCEEARRPYVELFLNCMRFWAGDQWRDIVQSTANRFDTRVIRPMGAEDWRLVDNQMPIYLRDAVSRAAGNWPRLECQPQDPTEMLDVQAAQIGTRFLDWRHRKDHEPWLRELEWLWMLGVGECMRQTIFDAEGGDPLYNEGDILTQVVDPFRYLKDPQSVLEWPPRFLIVREARHVDWIKENLGVVVEPETVADVQQYYDSLAMNVVAAGERKDRETMSQAAIVWQRFIPPSKKYPEGWCYVRVGKKLVRSHALQSGQWPFARGGWLPVPGRMYQMGLIELLMGDQRQLNSLVSLLYEAASKGVRGDRDVTGPIADARGIREFPINVKTGAKVRVFPPGVQDMATNYQADWTQAEVQRQRIDSNLHRKSGANEPTLGQSTQRQETLGAQVMAREADSVSSAWHLNRYSDQFLVEVARQKLQLAKDYYALPRRLEGLGGKEGMTYFEGADLRDTQEVIAVAVQNLTPGMKQIAEMEAYSGGMMGPYESLGHRYAAWTALKRRGLTDVVEQMETTYGTYEDLEKQLSEVAKIQAETEMVGTQMQLEMMMNPPAPVAEGPVAGGPPQGVPPQGGVGG
jgi:hypothetical protein